MSEPTDMAPIMRGARTAASQCTPRHLASWREDIAQEVAIDVWLLKQRGRLAGVRAYQLAARRAVRALLGDPRYEGRRLEHDRRVSLLDLHLVETPCEQHSLALWRLQRVWPTLTPFQRRAVQGLLMGEQPLEVARELGSSSSAVIEARRTALSRIDEPSAYTKVAWRPRDIESRRADAAARQRRYQARKRTEPIR